MTPIPAVVIGLGNPMRRDDGIGHAALAELAGEADLDLVELDGEATRVIEAWRDRPRAIVVDAVVSGDAPGTIHEVVVGRDRLPAWSATGGTHAAGVAEAVALGGALDRLPGELIVLGVEPGDVAHGQGLSPAVRAALPELVERIRVSAKAPA